MKSEKKLFSSFAALSVAAVAGAALVSLPVVASANDHDKGHEAAAGEKSCGADGKSCSGEEKECSGEKKECSGEKKADDHAAAGHDHAEEAHH